MDLDLKIECLRDGKVKLTFPIKVPGAIGAPPQRPAGEEVERLGQEALGEHQLGFPPFTGWKFRIRN